ncbi:hypothetical protein [Bradyrhizobium sp. 18]|uniref:hypothetical protein n=1 Tax=Bradyrhizobium sp. 18 TaxID=2782657 RepID=UPI001FFB2303|nr:hypothetical protein [Bradyrhizobium sp. 18]MCK1507199.1 hypothetical protein [Bradyrhizobium sp. 18]
MSRGVHAFKETDLTRAVRAVKKGGLSIGRVEIEKSGKIVIVPNPAPTGESNG